MRVCPCCERPVRGLKDAQKIKVINFKRLEIPEYIPDWEYVKTIPKEVKKLIKKRGKKKVVYNGAKYTQNPSTLEYKITRNERPKIRRVVKSKFVQKYFSRLESYIGKVIVPNQLAPNLEILSDGEKIGRTEFGIIHSPYFLQIGNSREYGQDKKVNINIRKCMNITHIAELVYVNIFNKKRNPITEK